MKHELNCKCEECTERTKRETWTPEKEEAEQQAEEDKRLWVGFTLNY